MKARRFIFTRLADQDLDHILSYLDCLPKEPALHIGRRLQLGLQLAGRQPMLGRPEDELSSKHKLPIRSWRSGDYRIYYVVHENLSEVFAVLHHAQDQSAILSARLT